MRFSHFRGKEPPNKSLHPTVLSHVEFEASFVIVGRCEQKAGFAKPGGG